MPPLLGQRPSAGDLPPEQWVEAYERLNSGSLRQAGREWNGPCPICGGDDRFHIAPGAVRGTAAGCRHGCSFADLAEALFGDRTSVTRVPAPAANTARTHPAAISPKVAEPPPVYEVAPPPSQPLDLEGLRELWPYDRAIAVYRFPAAGGWDGEVHEVKFLNANREKERCLCRPTGWGLVYGLTAAEYFQGKDRCWRKVSKRTPPGAPRKRIAETKVALYRPGDPDTPPHERPDAIAQARESGDWLLAVEGPKDADTAAALGFCATTSANGASGLRDYQAAELEGLRVVVIGDNDASGLAGLEKRIGLIHRAGANEVRKLEPLGGEPDSGYDLTDWVEELRQGAVPAEEIAAQLRCKIEEMAPWKPARKNTEKWATASTLSPSRPGYLVTDAANAERFLAQVGPSFKHCERLRAWLYWDGARYTEDWLNRAKDAARRTALEIYEEAAEAAAKARNEQDPDKRSQLQEVAEILASHASRSLGDRRLEAMLSVAKSHPKIAVDPADFDQDPMKLNTPSGLLDLRTGKLQPHPEDPVTASDLPRVTRVTRVPYVKAAPCPRWERFVREIFVDDETGQPDDELIAFVQRAVGYSLTASTEEHALFILHGGGGNGKTVFVETLKEILADYAQALQFDTLLQANRGQANHPDIVDLRGARIALASESTMGARFNEAMIKQLSGGDTLKAAKKYANPIEFKATHKLWLATNDPPQTYDESDAFWRRVFLIPFYVAFKRPDEYHLDRGPFERLRDPKLGQALRQELPGILAWAVEGCRQWQEEGGLGTCDAVRRATRQYREEQDQMAGFLHDVCVVEEGASIPFAELYAAYERWTEEAGEKAVAKKTFGQKLTKKGIRPGKVKSGGRSRRVRDGIRLRREAEERQAQDELPEVPDDPGSYQDTHAPAVPSLAHIVPEVRQAGQEPQASSPSLQTCPPSDPDPWQHHPWYQ